MHLHSVLQLVHRLQLAGEVHLFLYTSRLAMIHEKPFSSCRRVCRYGVGLSSLALLLSAGCAVENGDAVNEPSKDSGSSEVACDLCGMPPPNFEVVAEQTQKVCQLTGHWDYELVKIHGYTDDALAPNQTLKNRIFGLDLGASFEHDGRLWFVFGDTFANEYVPDMSEPCDAACMQNNMHLTSDDGTNTLNPVGADSIAYTNDNDPEDCVALTFVTKPSDPVQFENNTMDLLGDRAQQAGLSDGKNMYVWLSGDHYGSELGYSDNNGKTFKKLFDFSATTFGGVHAVMWQNVAIPGLAE